MCAPSRLATSLTCVSLPLPDHALLQAISVRTVLSHSRRDFIRLHKLLPNHQGIIVSMKSNSSGRIQYAFRRPRFPVIYGVGSELLSAKSPAEFQRQADGLGSQGPSVLDMVDATGEGWAFHCDLMIVSPLTIKKQWKKIELIRLFNKSDNARRLGVVYPEAHIPRRSLVRIIADLAVLVTDGRPNKPPRRRELA